MLYQVSHVIVFPRRGPDSSGIELDELGAPVSDESSFPLEQVCTRGNSMSENLLTVKRQDITSVRTSDVENGCSWVFTHRKFLTTLYWRMKCSMLMLLYLGIHQTVAWFASANP